MFSLAFVKGGGGERLSDWKYCLSFSRFFIPFYALFSLSFALVRETSYSVSLFLCCNECGVNRS